MDQEVGASPLINSKNHGSRDATVREWKVSTRTDAAVARALGLPVVRDDSTSRRWSLFHAGRRGRDLPYYSRDITAAMCALGMVREMDDYFELRNTTYWTAALQFRGGLDFSADADTAQLAICRLIIAMHAAKDSRAGASVLAVDKRASRATSRSTPAPAVAVTAAEVSP